MIALLFSKIFAKLYLLGLSIASKIPTVMGGRCGITAFVFFMIFSRAMFHKKMCSPVKYLILWQGHQNRAVFFHKSISFQQKCGISSWQKVHFICDVVFSVFLTMASYYEFHHVMLGTRNYLLAISWALSEAIVDWLTFFRIAKHLASKLLC